MTDFQEIPPECDATVNVTSFVHGDHSYTISTTDIRPFHHVQRRYDSQAGYTGKLGNYETMLFIDREPAMPPFGDMPAHSRLGVFQRYDTEDEARDGHQTFVTRVKQVLRETEVNHDPTLYGQPKQSYLLQLWQEVAELKNQHPVILTPEQIDKMEHALNDIMREP